jgi:hypothetical protein
MRLGGDAVVDPRTFAYMGHARTFGWYDLLEEDRFTCQCGWSGSAGQSATELFHELLQGNCPQCDTMLYIRSFPTLEEIRVAAAQGDERAIEQLATVEQVEQRQSRARGPS